MREFQRSFIRLIAVVCSAACEAMCTEPVTVNNSRTGLWTKSNRVVELVPDLVIGAESGDGNDVFGDVYAIAVNAKTEIFVLDPGLQRLVRFDQNGRYLQVIGTWGQGPGEFSMASALAFDRADSLYVADGRRIIVFDPGGTYVREINYGVGQGYVWSLHISGDDEFYATVVDPIRHRVIHRFRKYDPSNVHSFCETLAPADPRFATTIETRNSLGTIDLDSQGRVYFTRVVPYDIRIFSPAGDPLFVISKENDFPKSDDGYVVDDGQLRTVPVPKSLAIVALGNVFITATRDVQASQRIETVLDVFAMDGKLLTTTRLAKEVFLRCSDAEGRLYGVDREEYPKVVRYRITGLQDKSTGGSP